MNVAIVVGSANCVWNEYDKALDLLLSANIDGVYETFVINDTLPLFRDYIHHAVTLHPRKLPDWAKARNKAKLPEPGEVWAHRPDKNKIPTRWTNDWAGSSGLFACKIALELGFRKIVLCGVPMNPASGHIVRKKDWPLAKSFQPGWIVNKIAIMGKVKSFSGWTRELLGEPTVEWLQEE